MFIKYVCPNCKNSKCYTSVQKEKVLCKNCKTEMILPRTDITSEIFTTEEARYLGDEAIFNTVGKRVSDKHSVKHT